MKGVIHTSIIVAAISLIVGIISRATGQAVGPMALESHAFLNFTNTCLLVAITFALLQLVKGKS